MTLSEILTIEFGLELELVLAYDRRGRLTRLGFGFNLGFGGRALAEKPVPGIADELLLSERGGEKVRGCRGGLSMRILGAMIPDHGEERNEER